MLPVFRGPVGPVGDTSTPEAMPSDSRYYNRASQRIARVIVGCSLPRKYALPNAHPAMPSSPRRQNGGSISSKPLPSLPDHESSDDDDDTLAPPRQVFADDDNGSDSDDDLPPAFDAAVLDSESPETARPSRS